MKLTEMQLIAHVSKECGASTALFLGRLLYWSKRSGKLVDGRKWIYNTYDVWAEQTGLSPQTLKRAVVKLRKMGILEARATPGSWNRTLWYSVNELDWHPAPDHNGTMDKDTSVPISSTKKSPSLKTTITTTNTASITDAEGVEESVVDHKPKTAADVVAALKDKKAAVPIIQDTASAKQLKWYWREMLPRAFTDQQIIPPFTLKQEGQFKHLYIRCEGKAGGVLKQLFKDWSGCRSAVEAQTGKTAPTRPDIGWVLANLQVVLNWSQGKGETLQLVAPPKPSYVPAKQTATTKEKSKPIWLKD